jgi:Protein of unknown function (DUF3999)
MKLASAALMLAFLVATPEVRYFRYERPIQVPAGTAGQACFVIEPTVFAHAGPQLADLRLYANGAETPYMIRVATSTAGDVKAVPLLNAGVRGGHTVFDAELPEGRYSDVQLTVTAQNFIATVMVTGSKAKLGSSETKLGDFTIFDLSRQRLGRSTVLHLPESNFSYLHFRIAGALRPEDVTGISVGRMPASPPRYVAVAETSQAVVKDHATVVEFNVPANVPVDRVVFVPEAAPSAFSRDVAISARPVAEKIANDRDLPPMAVSSYGNLLRVHQVQEGKRIDEERLSVATSRESFDAPTHWTITIANGDDVPVSLKSVRLEMLERTMCFDAAGAAYSLHYGDAALAAPRYDYARLFSPQPNALQATVGQERLNPGWQPRPDERPFTERHPLLLWVALVAVIALLGAIALRTKKPTPGTS